MLKYDQIEKLEIAQQWLEEIVNSPEFSQLNFHPDVTLGDSLQGIEEVLKDHYPCGYLPPKFESPKEPYIRSWHEKLRGHIFVLLGEVAVSSLIVAALSGCVSLVCWGLSDIDKSVGNPLKPDFAAASSMYRGLAITSLGLSLGCSVVGGVIGGRKNA